MPVLAQTTIEAANASDASVKTASLRIELGHTHLTRQQVHELGTSSVVSLDQSVGEPVQIFADDRLIARGELIALDKKLGIRVTERNCPEAH